MGEVPTSDQEKESQRIEPIQSVVLTESASSSNRGLSIFIEDGDNLGQDVCARVGIIHKSTFMVYHVLGKISEGLKHEYKQTVQTFSKLDQGKEVCTILQAKWLKTTPQKLLAISTTHMLLIYDASGTDLFGQFEQFSCHNSHGPIRAFDAVGTNIFLGDGSGDITQLKVENSLPKISISIEAIKRQAHDGRICDICTSDKIMASCDANGIISIWTLPNLEKTVQFQTEIPECATNCIIWSDFVIGSYETGVIRFYDLQKHCLATLIRAHSGWIVSMDLALKTSTLLTVADDDRARLWQLEEESEVHVKHKACVKLTNLVPLNAKFLNNEGSLFAVNSYASKELLMFKIS